MDHQMVEGFILSLPKVALEYPFGEGVAVYKVEGKMFAVVKEDKLPVNLSLRCDPELTKVLRDKYESVMPGYNLNQRDWNTIILSGQLSWAETQDLIRHSYYLASELNEVG